MLENEANDAQIHASCSKFDANIREEASIILWTIWRSMRPLYSTLPACLDALAEDPGLHEALKHAHTIHSYEPIKNWTISSQMQICDSRDSTVNKNVHEFLEEIEESIVRAVDGRVSVPVWTPEDTSTSQGIRRHIANLRIPTMKGRPNLLLHEWGSFKSDPVLKGRLGNIFMPNNHTFLVNTSGSGKTRLLLEGLCDNWGFYFTSIVDSSLLGSSDVQKSIQSYVPNDPKFRASLPPDNAANYNTALMINRKIASKTFRQVFLARLIIFSLFAETMERRRVPHSCLDIYRERWLLLQLQPGLVHPKIWDIFDSLSCMLSAASDHYINAQTELHLKRVRELCASDSKTNPHQTPFFCVLDEAQFAATQHTTSFRSDQNGCHRPILREIVRAWEGQCSGQGVFMVVAGTGISKDVVDQAMASAIMKDSKYRWCSDTGAFDTVEVQRRYLTKYLPKSLLKSKSGERLLGRIWYWLRGRRHRFTAGYVVELIRNGFQRPHRLLNAYVRHFTEFSITDACGYVDAEARDSLPMFSQYKLDFSKLKKNSDMLSTIHQVTTHYLMRSITPPLGGDEAMYVEYGFARFVDSETRDIAIDEPLVLLAAIRWMNTNHQTSYKMLVREISTHNTTFNGFENYVAFSLDLVFSQPRRLNEVFTFHETPPTWAEMYAEIVSLHCNDSGDVETGVVSFANSFGPSVTLGVNAKSPTSVLDWLGHRTHSPFCFPHQSMGPDVMFILRLSDGSLIWVALQTKWSRGDKGNLAKRLLLQAMKSVTPSKYFLDKNDQPYSPTSHPTLPSDISESLLSLPGRREDAGKFSLLRVVASFPAQTRMKRYIEQDPDEDDHPIATLNMNLVKKITRKLSPQDFLQLQDVQEPPPPPPPSRGAKENRKRKETKEHGSGKRKK
ncbi:hypothetical protein P691DRAFT_627847, partial [Macrolepiota fuliginosa MF-IS2]